MHVQEKFWVTTRPILKPIIVCKAIAIEEHLFHYEMEIGQAKGVQKRDAHESLQGQLGRAQEVTSCTV
jgi:hypothetical protein